MSEAENKTEVELLRERIAALETRLATAEWRLAIVEGRPIMPPYVPPNQTPPYKWPWTVTWGGQMKDVNHV